jgi:hypothetical protein
MPPQNKKKPIRPNLSTLSEILPPIIMRSDVPKYLPGLFSRGHLQNLDSQHRGPKKIRISCGDVTAHARVAYIREDFLEWLGGIIKYDSSYLSEND